MSLPASAMTASVGQPSAPAFIAWTTTPWTLTANMALAVGPGEEYVLAESEEGGRAIVAASLKGDVLGDGWQEVARLTGEALTGIRVRRARTSALHWRGTRTAFSLPIT